VVGEEGEERPGEAEDRDDEEDEDVVGREHVVVVVALDEVREHAYRGDLYGTGWSVQFGLELR